MAIIGIGTDIVELKRIYKASQNSKFGAKILGENEFKIWQYRKYNINFLAKRFAAKEAFAKALGTGFIPPITWHTLEIISDKLGKPQFLFSGELAQFIQQNNYICHISLTDEKLYAIAYVVIEN